MCGIRNSIIPAANKVSKGLKPEKGNQWEIGTKGDVWQHRLHYEAAAYYTRFSDKMTVIAVPLNAATTAYTYVANGGSQDDKGIELSATCRAYHAPDGFFRSIDPFANFCYAHFRYAGYQFQTLDKDKKPAVADYDGKTVAGVPPLTFNAGADWTMQWGLYAGISYNHRDGMPITSDGAHRTAGYNLLNARLGIRQAIGKHFDLDVYFGADNLTGTRYYYMVFLNQLPDAYLPAPEKTSFYGGLGLSFRL